MPALPSPRIGLEPPPLPSGQLWLWLVFLMALVLGQLLFAQAYLHTPAQPFYPRTEVIYRV